MDNSFDDKNYGSRYTTGLTFSYRRDQREDFRDILKEIEPSDNFFNNRNDGPSQRNNYYEMTKHASPKADKLELEDAKDWLEDKQLDLQNDDNVNNFTHSQHAASIISGKKREKSSGKEVPVDIAEGYFSDFTNDTENDIEEEFDFD